MEPTSEEVVTPEQADEAVAEAVDVPAPAEETVPATVEDGDESTPAAE